MHGLYPRAPSNALRGAGARYAEPELEWHNDLKIREEQRRVRASTGMFAVNFAPLRVRIRDCEAAFSAPVLALLSSTPQAPKDAERDLFRLLLTTSAARVQFRSDADGSWSRPTSFFEIDVGFRFHLLTFPKGRHRRRPVLVSGVHANFLSYARVSQSGFLEDTALMCEECGVRFISRLK